MTALRVTLSVREFIMMLDIRYLLVLTLGVQFGVIAFALTSSDFVGEELLIAEGSTEQLESRWGQIIIQ